MARRWRECEDAWDGFDTQATVYNEKEEKQYEGTVWKYLGIAALVVLALVIYMHSKELHIIHNGTCIVASYKVDSLGKEIVRYYDENNRLYIYDVSGMSAMHGETEIRLYYLENIQEAVPQTKWWLWAMYYGFFAALLSVCVWRLYKIYKGAF